MKNTIITPDGKRKVCKIYDNGGATVDRYTVVLKAFRDGSALLYPYLSCCENPFHPQGFGQCGFAPAPVQGKHLGNRVVFDALPTDVQKFILQRI